jgi:sirohydrochlorin ferrochelatase
MMSDCLVLLAHGSKDPRWCVPFERIVDAVRGQSEKTKVRLAYMEFIEPTLMDVAHECVGQQILHLNIDAIAVSVRAMPVSSRSPCIVGLERAVFHNGDRVIWPRLLSRVVLTT